MSIDNSEVITDSNTTTRSINEELLHCDGENEWAILALISRQARSL